MVFEIRVASVAQTGRWQEAMAGVQDLFTIHDYSFYYDHLSEFFNSIEMWETNYLHIMDNHLSIIKMMRKYIR